MHVGGPALVGSDTANDSNDGSKADLYGPSFAIYIVPAHYQLVIRSCWISSGVLLFRWEGRHNQPA